MVSPDLQQLAGALQRCIVRYSGCHRRVPTPVLSHATKDPPQHGLPGRVSMGPSASLRISNWKPMPRNRSARNKLRAK